MKRPKISRDLFFLSILTVITTLTWIILDTYRAFSKIEIPKVLQEQIEPLNPELESKVFEDLSKRLLIEEGVLVLPTITPTPEATVSGEI